LRNEVTVIPVCLAAALAPGASLRLDLDPAVAVFRADDGRLYAIDDTCTHQDASLSDGWVEGCAVECPLHGSRFDLRTGEVDGPPATRPVRTHRIVVDGGMIHVELPAVAPARPAGPGSAGPRPRP
jgi:3-phenylpropionate/trans-cinnamate dioxygenase ferredoxin subunit